jgi:uncharacterized protein (DUF2141 family)
MNKRHHKYSFLLPNGAVRWLFLGGIALLVTACAQIVTPTGGPRDTKPPQVLKMAPQNNSTQFLTGTEIKITFDEYMEINNASDKVMVSPPLKSPPSFKVAGKTLIVEFNDTLKPNATYSLFFDNCIRDITENNPIPSLEYNFSGIVAGTVVDAYTLKPEKQVYVMLYPQDIDSLPMTQKPFYITKTSDMGAFSFSHVQQGKYKLFSLNDKNGNLLFDQFTERIGFSPSMVETGMSKDLKVKMFTQSDTVQHILKKSVPVKGKILIAFKKEATDVDFRLKEGNFKDRFICEFTQNRDTAYLYDKLLLPDTVTLFISDRQMQDTLVVSPSAERKVFRKFGESATRVSVTVSDAKERYNPLMITLNVPVKSIDSQRIKLYKLAVDTVEVPFNLVFTDSVRRKLILDFKKEEQQNYLLKILDSAFWGVNRMTNDSLKTQFTILTENDYGSLLVHFGNENRKAAIVQLVNEQNEVAKEQRLNDNGDISWPNLSPGTYQLRAIVDGNRNGKWDGGDYFKKLLPEEVEIFATPIQIRAKWDLEEKFIVK